MRDFYLCYPAILTNTLVPQLGLSSILQNQLGVALDAVTTYVAVFSFLHPGRLYYDTCTPLHPPVYMYVHVRDQNDNTTYASTRWVPTVRHILACEDVAGGS